MNAWSNTLAILIVSASIAACGGGGDDDVEGSTVSDLDAGKTHQVLAFNDLGMHCADLDYSVFTILPPFNVVNAQVIEKGEEPRILSDQEVAVSYRAVVDGAGSINTTSQNGSIWKTNFWAFNPDSGNRYVYDLFGLNPPPDEGLIFGQAMPGILQPYVANDPQAFNDFITEKQWFAAVGIPIVPIDDAGQTKPYPLMQISATANGETLANLDVVLPVASEADCQNCHATDQDRLTYADDPAALLNAAKRNILALHDAEHGTSLATSTPVLCASCHYSEALGVAWAGGSDKTLSNAIHEFHGYEANLPSDDINTCYQCHPGKVTKCLRGAMGNAGIICQDCHGDLLAVGSSSRDPWLDEPRCESCHTGDALSNLAGDAGTLVNTVDTEGTTDNIRLRQAWLNGDSSATPIVADNKRFAENTGTLYRNSLGHNGVACEGCHGSTHAIWPIANPDANDNRAAVELQGYPGTITECGVCHTSLDRTLNGPHGMHNVNSSAWNLGHESFYERDPNACKACHGQNLEGTVLSRTATDRQYYRDDDGDKISVPEGTPVSCTLCHGYPDSD